MAIRTFSTQERYKGGGTEQRKKLKKVRSVKIANLDKLRLSMKRDKNRFNRGVEGFADEATESSSAAISGTSSPNYMKATTSSSARKGSLQASSGNAAGNESSGSSVKSTSKFSKVSVQDFSDPAGVNIPVKVKSERKLKRVPSLKQSKKLSSKKSMKIRARYSQFPDIGIDQSEMLGFDIMGFQENTEITGEDMETDTESLNFNGFKGQDFMIRVGAKQKGILERSRSRKLTRIRSIRSSRMRQRPKSRLSGVGGTEVVSLEAEVSNAEPHYMKATTSQQARKNPEKGLARTSSLRPLRILAKIPSLRPRRSKVKKRPQATPVSGTGVNRPTCSSTLKKTQFPDEIELHSRDQEMDRISSFHVCPYSYCSIHGHRHHAPSQPLKEFISTKRRLFNNKKGEQPENQSRGGAQNVVSATETDHSEQIISTETYAVQELMNSRIKNAPDDEDDEMDFLIKIYAKPRRKWVTEGALSQDTEALNIAIYDQINVGEYEGKLADTFSNSSGSQEKQGVLNDDQQTQQQNSSMIALSSPLEFHDNESVFINDTLKPSITEEEPQKFLKNPLHLTSRDSEACPGGYLTNILADKQKYTSMWQLIYQELASNEASISEALGVIQAKEKEGEDGKTCREMSHKEDANYDTAATKKFELEQTAAIKLVQGALTAILQNDTRSYHQQSDSVPEMANNLITEEGFREGGQIYDKGLNQESAEKQLKMKHTGNTLLQKKAPNEHEMSEQKISKSLSKLRKMFVTAKFIKAMEKLKRINPRKPHYLATEPVSENERVYLRHLSMHERKDTEEWMLDYALRQAISRLDPNQQRRVAQLVEAFEKVAPELEENGNRPLPMKSMPAPRSKLAIPTNGEDDLYEEPKKNRSLYHEQLVQKQDDGALVFHKGISKEKISREDYKYLVNTTGDEILQDSAETKSSDSTLVFSEKSSKSANVNEASDAESTGHEKAIKTLKASSENLTQDSEVNLASDMANIFFNKQKYTSMWNLIYQHVSSEASVQEKLGIDGSNEERGEANCEEINDRDSTSRIYNMDQKEDDVNQNATFEKPDLDQSAAIKLVKEALSAILKRSEQPTHLESIQDHGMAVDSARDLCLLTPTFHTEGNSKDVESTSLPLQQQLGCDEFKEPQRKISKSLSKLKKAIATTRFIKAMERLMKSSPRKSQNLTPDTTSEEEKVYLRHRSMNGRKKNEEWMLDYALRQVVSKLAHAEQRKVALLVEAFENMHPEQQDKRIRCNPLKGEATNGDELTTPKRQEKENNLPFQQRQSTSIEQIHHNLGDGILLPTGDAILERNLQEYNQQESSADDIIVQVVNESTISDSTLKLSENESTVIASAAITLHEQNVRDEETRRCFENPSPYPTGNSKIKPEDEMVSILSDKQKYTSMWHMIYQHVLSNEESTDAKQEVNDIHEEEKGDGAKTCLALYDPGSTQNAQLMKSEVDEDNKSAASDQSAAIKLVKEAIHAILQCHEQKSSQQSLQDHSRVAGNFRELCDTDALPSTKENVGGKKVEKHRNSEMEEKLHKLENAGAPLQQQVEPKEAQTKMSKSLSKLKRAIVTTKFIKAMERLKKINPRKPRHLPAEATSEEERVYLRHLNMNAKKNDEEWMLDYALRKVISDLAPDQQRKVARLVEAFETVNPEQKGIGYAVNSDGDLAIEYESKIDKEKILGSKHESSTTSDDKIPAKHNDVLPIRDTSEENVQEDQSIKRSNLKTELPLDSNESNIDIHYQANSKGAALSEQLKILSEREESDDTNSIHELIQLAKDSQKDSNTSTTKGLFGNKQKNSSMWHLICQHLKPIDDAESGSKLNERLTNENQLNEVEASAEMIADERDMSSVTSELTENDAIEMVRDAINDILDERQGHENELNSANKTAEEPKKSLSRGYSQLRKYIICNRFIKAMEKTRNFYPQKHIDLALNSDSKKEKAKLKTCAAGDRKEMDEWMLDNVLQKAIAGLAPVKQKKVALLIEAFEKVNPDPEEQGKGPRCSRTEFLDTISLERDAKERENTVSLHNPKLPCSFDLKLDGSTISRREVATVPVPQEIHKDRISGLTEDTVSDEGIKRSKEPTETDGADESRVSLEERINSRDKADARLKDRNSKFANKSLQPEDLEGEWNHRAQESGSLGKSTSLWGLILQRVTTDMLEKDETPKPNEVDVDTQGDITKMLEREVDDSSQHPCKVKSCRDIGVQTPASFDFKEDEAIKLVEEAVEEMLLVQDQLSDTESMTSSTTSEQEVHRHNNGDSEESSLTATQIAEVAASHHLPTPNEEKMSSKKHLSNSYNTLSKVIMCKRFVKAMDKRRKLKVASTQEVAQPPQSEEGIPSLRQSTTSHKKNWEEGMLDNALQKVIGNLAPAKKQRVALLVQAFEAVGSQPEPTSGWRGKVTVS